MHPHGVELEIGLLSKPFKNQLVATGPSILGKCQLHHAELWES
jgi:hypothetical protein